MIPAGETSLDRFRGCLIGLACGDAVGGPVEFYRRGRFAQVTGMDGGGKFHLAPGEWTDDTAMALCLAESLRERGHNDPDDQMQRYWHWANEGHWSTRSHAFGMGKTVATALMAYRRTGNALSGPTSPDTAGNGSIMRLAPVAMFFHGNDAMLLEAAEQSSKTTHGAEESVAGCRFLALLLSRYLAGEPKDAGLDAAASLDLPVGMDRLSQQSFRTATRDQVRGTGYVVESLEAALWCFWHTSSYAEAVLAAANLGDDADTTAAICGQIAGAFYGFGTIPEDWKSKLLRLDEILTFADSLWRTSQAPT